MKNVLITLITIFIMLMSVYLFLYFSNTNLDVSNYDIYSEKINNSLNNYKIIQISDFHNTKYQRLTRNIVKVIKKEKPDIIVVTGDFIDSRKTNVDISLNFIDKLNEICPIYYVNGNHESRINNHYLKLKEGLTSLGVIILENNIISLNEDINILGINDPSFVHEDVSMNSRIVNEEIKSISYDASKFNILLSHRPELMDIYTENNIDLVFTGHAHGGQIKFPFIGAIYAPNQGLFPKYTDGEYLKNNTIMIVSRGIGNSLMPYRINNNPQLVIATLKSS